MCLGAIFSWLFKGLCAFVELRSSNWVKWTAKSNKNSQKQMIAIKWTHAMCTNSTAIYVQMFRGWLYLVCQYTQINSVCCVCQKSHSKASLTLWSLCEKIIYSIWWKLYDKSVLLFFFFFLHSFIVRKCCTSLWCVTWNEHLLYFFFWANTRACIFIHAHSHAHMHTHAQIEE